MSWKKALPAPSVLLLCVSLLTACSSKDERQVNLLLWSGYDHPTILEPFEENSGITINYKTFIGGDQMYSLLTQTPSEYDVVVVDPEYIQKLQANDFLAPLDPTEFDFSRYFTSFQNLPICWIDDQMFAVVVEYGSLGLVYNTERIATADARSYSVLFDPAMKGRVGMWDWYLPIMGVLSRSLGNEHPYQISDSEFERLRERLFEIRPQVGSIHETFPELMTALASGEVWIVPGGAGWLASALQAQGEPIDWLVPEEGGVMWMDTVAIPRQAPHPNEGKEFIRYMMTAKAQAALSQKPAYHSNVPNRDAYALLPDEHKDRLRVHNEAEVLALLSKIAVRRLPVNQSEKQWQDAWEAFKTH